MTSTRIATVIDELKAEETDLQAQLDRLRQELKDAEARLSQIRKAASSLQANSSAGAGKPQPTAPKEEILAMMMHLLREAGSLSEDKLKSFVEERLRAQGRSLVGFAMRFKSALKDQRFQASNGVLGLSTAKERAPMTAERPE